MPKVSEDKRYQGCQRTKGANGVRGQKVPRVPGSKAQKLKSSKALLGDRVFSRTHLRLSLSPEEGPSCLPFDLLVVYSPLVFYEYRIQQYIGWVFVFLYFV